VPAAGGLLEPAPAPSALAAEVDPNKLAFGAASDVVVAGLAPPKTEILGGSDVSLGAGVGVCCAVA